MFKKLVTNLPYSPGLLNQVGFYAMRLKQEEFVRRLGLVFGILALLLNLNLGLIAPEASVLASPSNDVVPGGIYGGDAKEMQNKAIDAIKDFEYTKVIYDHYGISENDIRNAKVVEIDTADETYRSVGKQAFGRGAEACVETEEGYDFCERSLHAAYNYRSKKVRALVGMRTGGAKHSADPWFALIESCGDVVIRKPQNEDISITKKLDHDQPKVVHHGDEVQYKIKISSNNEVGADNVVIQDTLPEHTTFLDYSPKDLFDHGSLNGRNLTLSSKKPGNGLGPNEQRYIFVTLRVDESAPDGAQLCNTASVTSQDDSAVATDEPCVTVEKAMQSADCTSLEMLGLGGSNDTRTFKVNASTKGGAKISGYEFDFGDGSAKQTLDTSDTETQASHTYSPGDYTASVEVKTKDANQSDSPKCDLSFRVDPPTEQPSVTCDYLRAFDTESTSELKREFEAAATANGGAVISKYELDFGDGKSTELANPDNRKQRIEHTYEKSGTYTVKLAIMSDQVTNDNTQSCQTALTISALPCTYNDDLTSDDAACIPPEDPCPEDSGSDDPFCKNPAAHIIKIKKVENLTQKIKDAHNTVAQAGDSIRYTLMTENDGTATKTGFRIREDIGDIVQYADIVDLDGGELSQDGFAVQWPLIDLKPGTRLQKTLTVKIKSPVPSTPVSASDPLSFDLKMENAYGNNVTVRLPASTGKQVEGAVSNLPNTGAGLNVLISTLFIMVITYFYFRNRLISKELDLIRNEFSGGAL